MYIETTHGIEVTVRPRYVREQSSPDSDYFLYAYHVTIRNTGSEIVQLLSRHWIITDGHCHVEEVRGEGVVGEQPVLQPGDYFEYTSACPLKTPTGNMRGTYNMVTGKGRRLSVRIPAFFLRIN